MATCPRRRVRVDLDFLLAASELFLLPLLHIFHILVNLNRTPQPQALLDKGFFELLISYISRRTCPLALDVHERAPIVRVGFRAVYTDAGPLPERNEALHLGAALLILP